MKRIDLHIHTTESDGTASPEEVVRLASESGLSAIAITDHDCIGRFDSVASAAAEQGIEAVPGIEFSTKYKGPVHILGYFIDPEQSELKQLLKQIVDDRDSRNEKITEKIRENFVNITYAELKDRFGSVVGRPHFAEILMENGIVSSVNEAFDSYLSKGGPLWFPRTTIPLEEIVRIIIRSGGIPVLAHPFEYKYNSKSLAELIEYCMAAGIRGIECRHSSHTCGQIMYLESLADEYGLLKTGGSDYHGDIKPDISLGSGKGELIVPYSWLEKLKAAR